MCLNLFYDRGNTDRNRTFDNRFRQAFAGNAREWKLRSHILGVLLHEIQHYIQIEENWIGGSNITKAEQYLKAQYKQQVTQSKEYQEIISNRILYSKSATNKKGHLAIPFFIRGLELYSLLRITISSITYDLIYYLDIFPVNFLDFP